MEKHILCKNSYTGFKDEDDNNPGCIWAFFRILSYHNVKRMLPYNQKNQKPKHHQICPPYEPEEDQMKMDSVSVTYDKKKSVKAKIKALLIANVDKPRKSDLVQQSQLKVQILNAPTLISLLEANPKPNTTNLMAKTRVGEKDSKEEEEEEVEVGVLEVFKVNEEQFLKVLKNRPLRKPMLSKSRTFPSPKPSHNKHDEIWPSGYEVKRSKSPRMGRSSSLKDTKTNKEIVIKKGLSRSFKLSNEKEFELLGYHHLDSPRDFDAQEEEEEEEEEIQEDEDYYKYKEEFKYVKYVLDLMGFTTGEDPYGAWHSTEQPLDPALFDGIEVCCPFEATYNRKVLFNLINEALLYVHERSYVCYPKKLSSSSHVRAVPKGRNRVVEEVWEFMSKYLRWRPEMDSVLNLAVPLELYEGGNGWMNLQKDCECLAIYLQHLIVDDLLDEIVYS